MLTAVSNYGFSLLDNISQAIKSGDWLQAETIIKKEQRNLSFAENLYVVVNWQRSIVDFQLPQNSIRYLQFGKNITLALNSSLEAQDDLKHIIDIAFNKEVGDSANYSQSMESNLSKANEALGFITAELGNGNYDERFVNQISSLKDQTKTNLEMGSVLSELLAFEDKKNILILLQDNQELRPTGGFIEGIAILTTEKGRIMDMQVHDVYSVDKLFEGTLIPPEEITKYLGEKNWWLRDSNLSPDFTTSAARAAWFTQKELGVTVNGVIAVNLNFFQEVLKATGGVFLPEFNETITANNVFERAHQHAEVNLLTVDGQQSSSFLVSLAQHFYEKLQTLPQQDWFSTNSSVYSSFEKRDAFIWLPDTTIQAHLANLGWDGQLRFPPSQLLEFGTIDLSDYLAFFEANFGVNKANYYIKHKLDHKLTIGDDGSVTVVTKLTIKNASISEAWPGGRYKDYLRFVLPTSTKINSIAVSSNPQTSGEELKVSDVIKKEEGSHRTVGLYVEVPPQEERIVTMIYKLGGQLPLNQNTVTYSLYLQKQSGMDPADYTISVAYPRSLKPTKMTQMGKIGIGELMFTGSLQKDQVIAVSFLR